MAVPLFAQCTRKELDAVARSGKVTKRKAGSDIVTQDKGGVAFFSILDGQVDILRDEKPIARLMTGEFFGEIGLLVDSPRNATARAATDVELFVISQFSFKSVLLDNAKISYAIARAVAERASNM